MNREHVISDEAFAEAQSAFSRYEHWVAYNTVNYFLDSGDMYFFKTADEAHEFSDNNISEYDNYRVIHAYSVDELLKRIPYGEYFEQQFSNAKNISIMNEKNFEYLRDNIRNHGFGETLGPELESQLLKGQPEFTLVHKTEVNKRDLEATLYFKKSPDTDMYFFNKYDTRLKNEKDETLSQTFYLNKGWGVTLKEAYNLLNGRAVHKELSDKQGEKYQAWIQLDFSVKDKNGNYERKQYHQNYGYDLKEALSYYPVKEMMKEDSAKMLLKSLERGNVQQVTLDIAGKEQKVFIEANPQYKTVTLYSAKMQRLDQGQRQDMMIKPAMQENKEQGKEKEKSKELGQEDQSEKKQGKGKKMNNPPGEGTGLVEKKRTHTSKKGLSI
jgi:hypothetical protein